MTPRGRSHCGCCLQPWAHPLPVHLQMGKRGPETRDVPRVAGLEGRSPVLRSGAHSGRCLISLPFPNFKLWPRAGLCGPLLPPSAVEPPPRPPRPRTWPYGHLALVQGAQEEGHAVRAQVAVLAGEAARHLQQVLLPGRVASVGGGQRGGVDRDLGVLGNDPVPAEGWHSLVLTRRGRTRNPPSTSAATGSVPPWVDPHCQHLSFETDKGTEEQKG